MVPYKTGADTDIFFFLGKRIITRKKFNSNHWIKFISLHNFDLKYLFLTEEQKQEQEELTVEQPSTKKVRLLIN